METLTTQHPCHFADYFAQGVSFKGDPWLMHLSLPKSGKLSQANILVPFTRPSLWSQKNLLAPLWPEGDYIAKRKFVAAVHNAFDPQSPARRAAHNEYLTEMARMRVLAACPTMAALHLHLMGKLMHIV